MNLMRKTLVKQALCGVPKDIQRFSDEQPARGPHHDAARAVSRIPSTKNS